jgi:hypothetical protein
VLQLSPSLRRSTRISKKLKSCKNITIIESTGKNSRVTKKRKIANFEELNTKLILPIAIPELDFPGLTDLNTNEPFPEISISTIQDVATTRRGLLPMEVTQELLLARTEELLCMGHAKESKEMNLSIG